MAQLLGHSQVWMVVAICMAALGFGLIVHLVTEHSPLAARLRPYRCVPLTAITAVALLFGLFSAFLGADIWARIGEVRQSVEIEIASVQTIDTISHNLGEDGKAIREKLRKYVDLCLPDKHAHARRAAANAALGELVQVILAPSRDEALSGPSRSTMLSAYYAIKEARAKRLHLFGTHADPHKWFAVVILGFLTQVAIAFAAPDERKGQFAGLVIFSLAFAISLSALAIHEAPLLRSENLPTAILKGSVGGGY
jgi:hypothetical protein